MSTTAEVRLWGRTIGAVSLADGAGTADFEYEKAFAGSGIEVSPLRMPLSRRVYTFPHLASESFRGLPGLLSDSLPDHFGNALIDAWLETQGRRPESFNAVERLCYVGQRGMGALEFVPSTGPEPGEGADIQVARLVDLAGQVLGQRQAVAVSIEDEDAERAMQEMLRVGTSAGGARAKAVIAWNPTTNEVRSGQVPAAAGFEHWLLKFDGVSGKVDRDVSIPQGYGAVEFAYSQMARDAGIHMSDCRLFEEGGRRHFMTRRFDRTATGARVHMQSLAGLAHYDFHQAGAYGYEQALRVIRQLGLPMRDVEEQFRRMVFNIVARNQDDHVKNIAFLMDKRGSWTLSPAFDLTWSFNPLGAWTAQHQMTLNGKRDDFTLEDLKACGRAASMKRGRPKTILDEVRSVVADWSRYAGEAGVSPGMCDGIESTLRTGPFPAR